MKVLLVDDEQENRRLVEFLFKARLKDVELISVDDPREAVRFVKEDPSICLVITDLMMPGMTGEDVLREVKAFNPGILVIVVTGHATVDKAVSLLKGGAYDFVSRPFKKEEFINRVSQALDRFRLSREVEELKEQLQQRDRVGPIVATSTVMRGILAKLDSIAKSNAPVLIRGESGTGKELIAHEIHRLSPRADGPFVAINCGAIPEELLESELFGAKKGSYTGAFADRKGVIREAQGGTLFLDEIGDLALSLQVKLLRFLQEGEIRPVGDARSIQVDVRVVAATNKPLEQAIEEVRFRQDLYYRLNVLPIHLPPLRERKEEVPILAEHFLRKFAREMGRDHGVTLSQLAIQKLCAYHWPGNIRELESVIHRAVVMAGNGEIGPSEIPLGQEENTRLFTAIEDKTFRDAKHEVVTRFEIGYVTRLLKQCHGNVPVAAEKAGQDRKSFWRIMTKHGINPATFR